jgi:hypothetical protein
VVINGLSVFQDSGYGLDEQDEGHKVVPEHINIVNFEEGIEHPRTAGPLVPVHLWG